MKHTRMRWDRRRIPIRRGRYAWGRRAVKGDGAVVSKGPLRGPDRPTETGRLWGAIAAAGRSAARGTFFFR